MNTQYFLSVDWGTSNFRLRLIEYNSLMIVEESSSSKGGVKNLYDFWNRIGGNRETFFLCFLNDQIKLLQTIVPVDTLVIVSGMASSNIGIKELKYAKLPFSIDGSDVVSHYLKATDKYEYDILLISGIKSENDVIRGEETQLIGCCKDEPEDTSTKIYIFPGTHSKHIYVRANKVVDFKTYMTGEFFDLLTKNSVLSSSVEKTDRATQRSWVNFEEGVNDAVNGNLLNVSFRVRTNNLFNKVNNKENFDYLSGLLIGTELQDLLSADFTHLYLVSDSNLNFYYEIALQVLGLIEKAVIFPPDVANDSVIKGQHRILKHISK